jgi:HD-GYP domain-containing protein (c-di-GMP phosphodiesterase class II)
MKLTDIEHGVACYGGLLYDVGKIGVSNSVLSKSGKLGPQEWTLTQSHVRVGRDLL